MSGRRACLSLISALTGGSTGPTPRTLIVAQRIVFFLVSLCSDRLLLAVLRRSPRRDLSLLLFASGPVALAFMTRPFGNAIEAATLALAWLVVDSPSSARARLLLFGVACAIGFWTRSSFAAFVLSLVVALSRQRDGVLNVLLTGLTAVVTGGLLVLFDSIYFMGTFPPPRLFLTPLASIAYNARTANLRLHGIHPRWLHLVVNGPKLYGALWFLALHRIFGQGKTSAELGMFCSCGLRFGVDSMQFRRAS